MPGGFCTGTCVTVAECASWPHHLQVKAGAAAVASLEAALVRERAGAEEAAGKLRRINKQAAEQYEALKVGQGASYHSRG